jgi:hypothetical protein
MSRFLTKILNEKPGENKPKFEVVSKVDQTQTIPEHKTDQTQSNSSPDRTQTSLTSSKSIAPNRDFNKRANILEREALPNGLFPGASKAIYDALYLRTLGSINPKRTVQATRKELMKWSGIKNIKTINVHIKRLKDLGLIRITNFTGEQNGSHYEVFLPDEDNPDQTQTIGKPDPTQKLDSDQDQKMVWVGSGKITENKEVSITPKTSLKTNTNNDDEAFAQFIEKFQSASREITGRKLSGREAENLGNLADLLILELKAVARRTGVVSNVPAFLTEVLRRQFFVSRQQQSISSKSSKLKKDAVGKSEVESYEIKPIDEKGREEALAQLREFAADDFLQDFKKWYTTEDWMWLIENLGVSDKQ